MTIEGDIIKTIRVAQEQKCENKEPSHSFSSTCTFFSIRFYIYIYKVNLSMILKSGFVFAYSLIGLTEIIQHDIAAWAI